MTELMSSVEKGFLDEMMKSAAEAGAVAAMQYLKKENEERKAKYKKTLFANTKVLISNYKDFKAFIKGAIFDINTMDEALDSGAFELLESLGTKALTVESIKSSVAKTSLIMIHVDAALSKFKDMCEKAGEVEKRRYDEMYDVYLSDEALSISKCIRKYFIGRATFSDDMKWCYEKLGILIFGVNGIKLDK